MSGSSNTNYNSSFNSNYAYNPSPAQTPVFYSAAEARNSLASEEAVNNEIRLLEQSVFSAIQQGLFQAQVSNGTLMTNSSTVVPLTWTLSGTMLNIPGHPFNTGDIVTVSSTGVLPTPLAQATYYYVIYVDINTIMLAQSYADATQLRPVAISITNNGTGTYYIYAYYSSRDYYAAWQGQVMTNPLLSPNYNNQMNSVISYFSSMGYNINRIVNTVTGNTLIWTLQW